MKWTLSGWAAIAESSHSKERVLKSWPKLRVTRDWEEIGRPPLDYSYTVNQLTPGGHQMTREQRKDWLEGVGFVAIIASLVFVGFETRNSTQQAVLTAQAMEISSYQELMGNIAELNMLAVQDAEVATLLHKAFRTSEELSEVEQYRLYRNLFTRFRHGDMAYFQFERGAISEAQLSSVLTILILNNPRVLEFWEERQGFFVGLTGTTSIS